MPATLARAVTVTLAASVVLAGCGGDAPALGRAAWTGCGPPVIAHRGEPSAAPEESMRSFRAAVRHGAEVLEGDVHFTRDGHPVLIHDDTVDRTTNGTGRVDHQTLAEVRRLDSGAGTQVPRLGELLDLARQQDLRLVLELKQPHATRRQVRAFWHAVQRRGDADQVTVESFHPENLRLTRSVAPQAETALITSTPVPASRAADLGEAIIPSIDVADRGRVRQWHGAGLEVWVWTADTRQDWRRARSAGVDGVMTNRTEAYVDWIDAGCR
ncbi:MAG TPA: glycerophosphodiester phosphodiesterase family protein [Segeticoccus sp.]|nr:glycerophosphodiester phosphodiesterase family protein [Segeticoccus sp.]